MTRTTASTLVVAICALTASPAAAEGGDHPIVNLDQLKWGPAPPSLPPGIEAAVQSGDPTRRGQFAVVIRGPQGYKVPPHWHSTEEHVTVLSGNFTMGMGDRLDAVAGTALTNGGYALMPRRTHHWAMSASPFVIQIQAMGPFDIHYVNPADNPQKPAKK
jgi:hypothetical protein